MNNQDNNVKKGLFYRAFFRNPVLVELVGISSVAAIAVSAETAIYLAIVTMVLLIVAEGITSLILKRLPAWIRIAVYVLIGTLVVTPFVVTMQKVSSTNLNLFLPLAAINSIIVLHCERAAVRHGLKGALRDAFAASFGYGVVAVVTGIIREFLGAGTVFGIDTGAKIYLSGMLMPFGGFLVLGFLAAMLSNNLNRIYGGRKSENAFDMSSVETLSVFALMLSNAKGISRQFSSLKNRNGARKPVKMKAKQKPERIPDAAAAAPAAETAKEESSGGNASNKNTENEQSESGRQTAPQERTAPPNPASYERMSRYAGNASTLPIVTTTARANYTSDFDEILKDLSEFNSRKNQNKNDNNTQETDKTGGE